MTGATNSRGPQVVPKAGTYRAAQNCLPHAESMSGHSDLFRHDVNINVVTGVPPRRHRQLQLFKVMFTAFESTLAKVEFVWKTAISPAVVTLSSAAEAMAMLAAGPTARLLPPKLRRLARLVLCRCRDLALEIPGSLRPCKPT